MRQHTAAGVRAGVRHRHAYCCHHIGTKVLHGLRESQQQAAGSRQKQPAASSLGDSLPPVWCVWLQRWQQGGARTNIVECTGCQRVECLNKLCWAGRASCCYLSCFPVLHCCLLLGGCGSVHRVRIGESLEGVTVLRFLLHSGLQLSPVAAACTQMHSANRHTAHTPTHRRTLNVAASSSSSAQGSATTSWMTNSNSRPAVRVLGKWGTVLRGTPKSSVTQVHLLNCMQSPPIQSQLQSPVHLIPTPDPNSNPHKSHSNCNGHRSKLLCSCCMQTPGLRQEWGAFHSVPPAPAHLQTCSVSLARASPASLLPACVPLRLLPGRQQGIAGLLMCCCCCGVLLPA